MFFQTSLLLYLVSLHISIWLFAYIFMVSLGIFYIYCWLAVAFVTFANDLLLKIKQFFKFFVQCNAQDQSELCRGIKLTGFDGADRIPRYAYDRRQLDLGQSGLHPGFPDMVF